MLGLGVFWEEVMKGRSGRRWGRGMNFKDEGGGGGVEGGEDEGC